MPSTGLIISLCSTFLIGAKTSAATDDKPSAYSQVVSVAPPRVWQACLKQTTHSQGYRIETDHNPYVLWLFFDFGDATHPMSEFASYANLGGGPEYRYGSAEIKLTVQRVGEDHTKISATGYFQLLSLPKTAAYWPLYSKGVLEQAVLDSITQSFDPAKTR
jgi:hypothetical protein